MGCGSSDSKDVSLPLHYKPDGVSSEEEEDIYPYQLDPCQDGFNTEQLVNGYLIRSSIVGLNKLDTPLRQDLDLGNDPTYSRDMISLQLPTNHCSVFSSLAGNRASVLTMDPFTTNLSVINPYNSTRITIPTILNSQTIQVQNSTHISRSIQLDKDQIEKSKDCSDSNKIPENIINTKLSGIFNENDLNDYTRPTVYNIFIWSRHEIHHKDLFPSSFVYEVNLNQESIQQKFKTFCVINEDFKEAPAIMDAVVYNYTSEKDRNMIYIIYNNFKHVPTHLILCDSDEIYQNALEFAFNLNAVCIKSSEKWTVYLQVVFQNDRRMYLTLKRMFKKMNYSKTGYVTMQELNQLSVELDVYISELDITQMLRALDIDRDGKINFTELCAWWKKGRKGLKSFQTLMEALASKSAAKVPGASKVIHKMGIRNTTTNAQKTLSVSVGKQFDKFKSRFYMKLGDIEELESVIHSKGATLGLRNEQVWIVFNFKTRSEISNSVLKCFKKSVKSYIHSYFKIVSSEKLTDLISVKATKHNNDLLIGFSINTESPLIEPYSYIIKLSNILSEPKFLLKAQFELKLQSGVKQLQQEDHRNFIITALDGLKFSLELLHSVDTLNYLLNLCYSKHDFCIKNLLPFLLRNSKVTLNFKSFKELPNFFMKYISEDDSYPSGHLFVMMIQHFVAELANKNNDLNKIFTISANHFTDDFEVFLKYKEKAAQVSLYMKGIVEMLNQIIET